MQLCNANDAHPHVAIFMPSNNIVAYWHVNCFTPNRTSLPELPGLPKGFPRIMFYRFPI